jgi:hypothetical protein
MQNTFDIFKYTDNEGNVSYGIEPSGQRPNVQKGVTVKQLTSQTPTHLVSGAIAMLDHVRKTELA